MESARAANAADLPALEGLADAGLAELAPTRGGDLWQRREARNAPVAASLAADLADPTVAVFVGCIDEVVLGYAVVRTERLRDGTDLGVLSDIYVDPGARGVGIGEAMMDLVIDWCSSRGCVGVDSLALPGNRATKNFFERFGLTARAIVVHKSLIRPPGDEADV